jgi:hypothetical protein
MAAPVGERVFLSEGGVQVSNSRFMVLGQTYAMSGITSVTALELRPLRKGAIICIALGLLMLFMVGNQSQGVTGGLFFVGIGLLWWALKKNKYSMVLNSASGEVEALTSTDALFISRVVAALNEAIAARG